MPMTPEMLATPEMLTPAKSSLGAGFAPAGSKPCSTSQFCSMVSCKTGLRFRATGSNPAVSGTECTP